MVEGLLRLHEALGSISSTKEWGRAKRAGFASLILSWMTQNGSSCRPRGMSAQWESGFLAGNF